LKERCPQKIRRDKPTRCGVLLKWPVRSALEEEEEEELYLRWNGGGADEELVEAQKLHPTPYTLHPKL
jgi:hypothetical protein